jgi:hypothetical protein
MRISAGSAATLVLIAGLASSQGAIAQGACGDVRFTGPVLSQFPEAQEACLGIETREGRQYAHFEAEIQGVSGQQVRARFKLPNGQYSETFSFTPSSNARVTIAGQQYRYRDLARGQELDVYLPPDRWELNVPETANFASATVVETVTPAPITSGAVAAATLPRTATLLPFLGLMGGLLTELGVGLTLIRRRFF